MQSTSRGFTLVELAVVIAIIAILAAVAVPRFMDTTTSAEEAMAKDLAPQLTSAAAIYTARHQKTPDTFSEFVTNDELGADDEFTITLKNFGSNPGQCSVGDTIDCSAAFNKVTASYTFENGVVTSEIARK